MSRKLFALAAAAALAAGAAQAQDAQHGHTVFDKWCAGCHAAGPAKQTNPGQGLVGRVFAGTYTLEQRYKGAKPAALEQRTDLTPDFIRIIVRNGLNMMPRSRKTEISDADLADVAAYLTRNNK